MYLIKINGKQLEYPTIASDIKCTQYVDLVKAIGKFNPEANIYQKTEQLAMCLSEFWGIPLIEFAEVDSDLNDVQALYSGLEEIKNFNSIAGYVQGIFNIIQDYRAKTGTETLEFTYKDRLWKVPHFKASAFTETWLRPPLSFGKVMRISEAKRKASKYVGQKYTLAEEKISIEENKEDKTKPIVRAGQDKDPNGNYHITELLNIVAMLAENEEIDKQITDIDERIQYFKDIDMQTGLDLYFFLINILTQSQTMEDLVSFSTHQE